MGWSRTFVVAAPAAATPALVAALRASVVPPDRERLAAAGSDGDLLAGLAPGPEEFLPIGDAAVQRCLAFVFPIDDAVRAFAAQEETIAGAPAGHAAVGCIWTTLRTGARWVLLEATSATTAMAELFATSDAVRRTFEALGAACGDAVVALADEWGGVRTLVRAHALPDAPADGDMVDRAVRAYLSA